MYNKISKINKCSLFTIVAAFCIICSLSVTVFATPSISDLHGNEQTTTIKATSTDGTNTAEILSKSNLYTNEALSDQYKIKDKDGNLVSTPLSDVIDLAGEDITVSGENGNPIPDEIPTVEEIIKSYCAASNADMPTDQDVDLKSLDQITYWLDLKYEETDYRVITGVEVDNNGKNVELDDGMIETEIDGGELLRAADIKDFRIIQIDAATGEVHILELKDYDAETGKYIVDFPCVGPYMLTQIIAS